MDNIVRAIEIAEKLKSDIEIWYLEQNKIIQELKEKLEEYQYPNYFTSEEEEQTEEEIK